MNRAEAIQIGYLVAIVCFVVGLRMLGAPPTARRGNQVAAFGMAVAVAATLADERIENVLLIVLAAGVGSAIGAYSARAVRMTAMPQMVALFNGVGGGAAALVALAEFDHRLDTGGFGTVSGTAIALSLVIGSVSFAGSLVAFAKLQELIGGQPIRFAGQQVLNAALALAAVGLAAYAPIADAEWALQVAAVLALALGVLAVLPIGGADMPVVISLLNSFTGLAAASAGFLLHNTALIVAGTHRRRVRHAAHAHDGPRHEPPDHERAVRRVRPDRLDGGGGRLRGRSTDGAVREVQPADAAVMLAYAQRVVIVPGYGLAVAQAQHVARELAGALERRKVDVRYAIHPVAGRMPGHMNVLLAEADVPYPQLYEMDEINPEFERTDVVLVVGANDVTNPAARTSPESPIYGMPILEVDRARQVIVLKRSMSPGFAGVDNELYFAENCAMLFGDAKASLQRLMAELDHV